LTTLATIDILWQKKQKRSLGSGLRTKLWEETLIFEDTQIPLQHSGLRLDYSRVQAEYKEVSK